jgi:hypothetical protein
MPAVPANRTHDAQHAEQMHNTKRQQCAMVHQTTPGCQRERGGTLPTNGNAFFASADSIIPLPPLSCYSLARTYRGERVQQVVELLVRQRGEWVTESQPLVHANAPVKVEICAADLRDCLPAAPPPSPRHAHEHRVEAHTNATADMDTPPQCTSAPPPSPRCTTHLLLRGRASATDLVQGRKLLWGEEAVSTHVQQFEQPQ